MLFDKYQYSEKDIQKRGYSHHCTITNEDGNRFWVKWILGIGKDDTKLKMLSDRLRKLQGAKHSCLPDIIDYGFDKEYKAYAIVYSYLENAESLPGRISQLNMQSIMSGLIDVAECLNLLFTRNKINHGDLHPENVFIDKSGQFFLIDFQLAETTRMFSQEKDLVVFTAAFSVQKNWGG
jgi:thiamine kinase-like enzyme